MTRILPPAAVLIAACSIAAGDPTLPDFGSATFDSASSRSNHAYYPLTPGSFSVYEGVVSDDDGNLVTEHIETHVLRRTKTILGVETRVVRDSAWVDGRLVEIALDWYAQSTDGTVWYLGEAVRNFEYDDDGDLIDINDDGSWIADGGTNFPGAIMLAAPQIDDEYYQEWAPGVAFDFAHIDSLTGHVDIGYGVFDNVLITGEGNFFDGPDTVENKLYAPGEGLVLIQELDDLGAPEFEIELIEKRSIPTPGAGVVVGLAAIGATRRSRKPG